MGTAARIEKYAMMINMRFEAIIFWFANIRGPAHSDFLKPRMAAKWQPATMNFHRTANSITLGESEKGNRRQATGLGARADHALR